MSSLSTNKPASNRSFWSRHRWLVLRRLSQLSILVLFLIGPWFGIWWLKGNLSASLLLEKIPLTDPMLLLQMAAAGYWPTQHIWLGALIMGGIYALIGGRLFCGWVCPVNMVTDLADWLRPKLGIKGGAMVSRRARYWLLAVLLVATAFTQTLLWEIINPVSLMARSIVFGLSGGTFVIVAVFLMDLLLLKRGWCGHLCPLGAFYRILGSQGLFAVNSKARAACDDCMDCYQVCPEPQILRPALKGTSVDSTIIAADCTLCGRCIDVCEKQVFEFGRSVPVVNDFSNKMEKTA